MYKLPSERKIEKLISALHLERPVAALPAPVRHALARRRYGWIDGLIALQDGYRDRRSLIETERLNTIFVHIPKAAGLSVAESLFSSHVAAHTPLYMFLALYGSRRFDRMFKFTFVRHPIDRVASAFTFLKAGGLTETDRLWAAENLRAYSDLNHFLTEGLRRPEIADWVHFKPQLYFLTDPRSGKIGVDYIGRFETLNTDFDEIARRLGSPARLKHINRSVRRETAISPAARRAAEEVYKADFDALNY
jgi:hypothetical protein